MQNRYLWVGHKCSTERRHAQIEEMWSMKKSMRGGAESDDEESVRYT